MVYYGQTIIDSPPGGNCNGRFDPGETGKLLVSLRNAGNETADDLSGVLRSGHPDFTVLDSVATFGTVEPGSTSVNTATPFMASVGSNVPLETPIPCSLFIEEGTDYADTVVFQVVVGEVRALDPIPDGPRRPALYWAYEDLDTTYDEHPDFAWVDITGVGTNLGITSDDQTVQVNLPTAFGPFVFYGQSYTQLSVCGNGWVGPGHTLNRDYTNIALPNGTEPTMLALVWDDLYPPSSNGIWGYHDEANHRYIIQYDSMPYYGARDVYDWYQVIIYDTTMAAEDGNSEFTYQYLTANGYNSCTIGTNDSASVIGIQALFDGVYHRGANTVEPGRAIKFTTDDPTTGIAEQQPARLPRSRYASVRAWPNPFTTGTRLALELASPAEVDVSVYDNNGRLVRSLASGYPVSGRSSLTWNGIDNNGRAVAPGMYFVRLVSDETDTWTKVVLSR